MRHQVIDFITGRVRSSVLRGLSKTCRDDAGTVLQAEMPGQSPIKDAGTMATPGQYRKPIKLQTETPGQWRRCTMADRRPVSNYQGTCQASFNRNNSDYGVMLS